MLSIEECKRTLEKYGDNYTEEEVKKIKEVLYQIAELDYQNFKTGKYEERHHLHESVNRRASGQRV
jgi:hypothetical protein